jgi:hypothetical protein
MLRKYLVIEDLSHRFSEFSRAVHEHCAENTNHRIEADHVDNISEIFDDRPVDQSDKRSFPIDRLAQYDAFFVDFRLASKRFNQVGTFKLCSPSGQSQTVDATSGVGVMLYLNQVFESDVYQRERTAVVMERPARRLRPQLLSFTLLSEMPTKFYAPAVQSWFGASHFNAHTNLVMIRRQLSDIDDLAGRHHRESQEVKRAVPAFDQLIDTVIATQSAQTWNHQPGRSDRVIDEMYDWLGLYLSSLGKRGGMQGFKEQASKKFGLQPNWKRNGTANQYAPHVKEMQKAVLNYLNAFTPPCEMFDTPDDWSVRDIRDPLWDILNDSRDFWVEPDVRIALMHHRARTKAAHRAGSYTASP